MSAYIVDRNQIRCLVSSAMPGNLSRKGLYWYGDGPKNMSRETANKTGQMLWEQNIKSVLCRYPDCDRTTAPGPVDESYVYVHLESHITSPVEVLKACQSYRYQCCEDPDWINTEAYAYITSLMDRAISALPGYNEAEW